MELSPIWDKKKKKSKNTHQVVFCFLQVLNSVAKEILVYLGDNSVKKEGRPSLSIISTAYGRDMSIHCNCFTAARKTNWLTQCA